MSTPLKAPCPVCAGEGSLPLQPALVATYLLLGDSPQATRQILERASRSVSMQTLLARLHRLAELGFALRLGKVARSCYWIRAVLPCGNIGPSAAMPAPAPPPRLLPVHWALYSLLSEIPQSTVTLKERTFAKTRQATFARLSRLAEQDYAVRLGKRDRSHLWIRGPRPSPASSSRNEGRQVAFSFAYDD